MKVAIYQGKGKTTHVDENLSLIQSAAFSAAEQGARLIIFPELFLTGYNIGDTVFELAESIKSIHLHFILEGLLFPRIHYRRHGSLESPQHLFDVFLTVGGGKKGPKGKDW